MLLALLTLSSSAFAQNTEDLTIDFELFRPQADSYGYSVIQGASTLSNLQLGAGLWIHYQNDPVVLRDAEGNRLSVGGGDPSKDSGDGFVEHRIAANVQAGMGFTRYASLSVDLPIVVSQQAWTTDALNDPTVDPILGPSAGLGDLRLIPKVASLDRDKFPIGLAVVIPVGLPTGGAAGFLGEKNVTLAPTVAVEWSNASIRSRDYMIRAAANVGYLVRTNEARVRDTRLGSSVLYGLGVGVHPIAPLEINLEFHGQSYGGRASQNPAELLLGAKIFAGEVVVVSLGGGMGLLSGVGAPDARMYAGLQFIPNFDPAMRDSDGDEITDGNDGCPKDNEDLDGFQDTDGCPELDNDADGREDAVDKCPDDPEDDDGYMDNDGCPDADNDKDGVKDDMDRCPDEAEIVNNYMDEDGCPDSSDTDGDGYADDVDRCPYDTEDKDKFEDQDGCPELDNDGDAIPDATDQCPNQREVYNNVTDEDGCPDDSSRVVVEASQIRINDVIYFDAGKATIQQRSYDLLNEIAAVVVAHPEIKKIRVEGHTDSDGNDLANLKLSQARAESVRAYLMSKGVEAERLDPAGFGEARPIADNKSSDGKSKNRRVEFVIVERQ